MKKKQVQSNKNQNARDESHPVPWGNLDDRKHCASSSTLRLQRSSVRYDISPSAVQLGQHLHRRKRFFSLQERSGERIRRTRSRFEPLNRSAAFTPPLRCRSFGVNAAFHKVGS